MARFKTGDRVVRVRENALRSTKFGVVGGEYTVVSCSNTVLQLKELKGRGCDPSYFELVPSKKKSKGRMTLGSFVSKHTS